LILASKKGSTQLVNLLISRNSRINHQSEKGSALILAVIAGHRGVVELLIDNKAELEETFLAGTLKGTALILAVVKGDADMATLLCQKGSIVNAQDSNGYTPLMHSLQQGRLEITETLLQHNAQTETTQNTDKRTVLMCACLGGVVDFATILVNNGADVNAVDRNGATALLQTTCLSGNVQVAEFLISKGAQVNIKDKIKGWTPLMHASNWGFKDVATLLIAHKAEINDRCDGGALKGSTALVMAAAAGQKEVVTCLCVNGALLDIQNDAGNTAFILSVDKNHQEIVSKLLESDADVNIQNKLGFTALMKASKENNLGIVRSILQNKNCIANPSLANKQKLTALHLSCSMDVAKALCDFRAPIEATDLGMFTPIVRASQAGHDDVVCLLLEKRANPNSSGWNGNTSLHVACHRGHDKVVRTLLSDPRLNLNCQNIYGFTALHLASRACHISIVGLLIEKGANVNTQDKNGNTPFHLAMVQGNEPVIELFLGLSNPQLMSLKNVYGCNAITYGHSFCPNEGNKNTVAKYAQFLGPSPILPALKFSEIAQLVLRRVSLSNVNLILTKHVVEAGEFPHYDACKSNCWHINGENVAPGEKVLFVSHRWASDSHPDPDKKQFGILTKFLAHIREEFKYVWLDYACICQARGSELFWTHLDNIPTAVWLSTHCLIIPKLEPLKHTWGPLANQQIADASCLKDYLGRSWCIFESIACMLTNTSLFCALQLGAFIVFEKFEEPEGASQLGFTHLSSNVRSRLAHGKHDDYVHVNRDHLHHLWEVDEPLKILELLSKVLVSEDARTRKIVEQSKHLRLEMKQLQETMNVPEIKELWKLLGECKMDEDKLIVFRLLVFVGIYSADICAPPPTPRNDCVCLLV